MPCAVPRSQRCCHSSSSSDRPTRNPALSGNLARWTISTGPVLNRRSVSAGKYRIGPIQFLLDHVFSTRPQGTRPRHWVARPKALCFKTKANPKTVIRILLMVGQCWSSIFKLKWSYWCVPVTGFHLWACEPLCSGLLGILSTADTLLITTEGSDMSHNKV